MARRAYTQREWRLLSWWLATYHAQAEIWMNVRVGPALRLQAPGVPQPLPEGLARLRNRWADAIFVEHGAPTIVEAKIDPDPGVYSTLVHYARKFRADPRWYAYAASPLRLVALVYHDDPSVAEEAPWYGVEWVVYQPSLTDFPPAVQAWGEPLGLGTPPELPHDWAARLNAWGIRALGQ